MKLLASILTACLWMTCPAFVFAQTQYEAKAIFKKGDSTYQTPVFISMNSEVLKIDGKKDKKFQKIFVYADIKKTDYSYTERPLIIEGIGVASLYAYLGLGSYSNLHLVGAVAIGLVFVFTKRKRHWLVLTAKDETFLFELKKADYRQLIFEMNTRKINIQDLGKMKKPK